MLRENLVSSEHEIWDLGFVESEYSFYDLVEKQTLQTKCLGYLHAKKVSKYYKLF